MTLQNVKTTLQSMLQMSKIQWSKKVKEIRKMYGWSKVRLAKELGVSRQAVTAWERKEYKPSADHAVELFLLESKYLKERGNHDEQ